MENEAKTLRLSVTEACNFRCRYCMPGKRRRPAPESQVSLEQLAQAVAWLAEHCRVDRVKLTGGEPLLRPELSRLVLLLKQIPQLQEVSLTSNGSLLAQQAQQLSLAGLDRVNISLDTLDPGRFRDITRCGRLGQSLAGIEAALHFDLTPIKINSVLRSSWRTDVPALLDFAGQRGLQVRFIELMRTGTEAAWAEREYVSAAEVQAGLELWGEDKQSSTKMAPAREQLVRWRGRGVSVGWITPRSVPFCLSCNRLRLDAKGFLRRCLMDPQRLPLLSLLQHQTTQQVSAEVADYLAAKRIPRTMESALSMSVVGG